MYKKAQGKLLASTAAGAAVGSLIPIPVVGTAAGIAASLAADYAYDPASRATKKFMYGPGGKQQIANAQKSKQTMYKNQGRGLTSAGKPYSTRFANMAGTRNSNMYKKQANIIDTINRAQAVLTGIAGSQEKRASADKQDLLYLESFIAVCKEAGVSPGELLKEAGLPSMAIKGALKFIPNSVKKMGIKWGAKLGGKAMGLARGAKGLVKVNPVKAGVKGFKGTKIGNLLTGTRTKYTSAANKLRRQSGIWNNPNARAAYGKKHGAKALGRLEKSVNGGMGVRKTNLGLAGGIAGGGLMWGPMMMPGGPKPAMAQAPQSMVRRAPAMANNAMRYR